MFDPVGVFRRVNRVLFIFVTRTARAYYNNIIMYNAYTDVLGVYICDGVIDPVYTATAVCAVRVRTIV